jgi:polysaccharide chain length determinant protein (PEP-CTERM system associated)
MQKDVYEASTKILVDTSSVLTPLLRDQVVASDPTTRLVQARQTLVSRTNLEKVALDNNLNAAAVTEADKERVLARLSSSIEISTTPAGQQAGINARDTGFVIAISYRHPDPRRAVGVVTSLKDILIERVLASSRERSEVAGGYLEREIATNNALLELAEQERLDFLRENSDRLPNSGIGIQGQIQSEEKALQDAQRQRRLAESTRTRLQEQLRTQSRVVPGSNPVGAREPAPGSLDAQIRDARRELGQLMSRYLPAHPAVEDAQNRLNDLEEQREAQLRELGILDSEQELSNLEANTVYEETVLELNRVDVEVARLDTDVEDRQRQITELRSQMEDVLAVETRLEGLNRAVARYDEVRISLEDARQRQQRTEDVAETDQLEFQVTDPPRAGTSPVAPKRLLLLAATFAAALGASGGVCWLLAQVKPVFRTPRVLREVTGLPILGCVGHVTISKRARARQRLSVLAFGGAMACLVVVFGAAMLMESIGPGARSLLGFA